MLFDGILQFHFSKPFRSAIEVVREQKGAVENEPKAALMIGNAAATRIMVVAWTARETKESLGQGSLRDGNIWKFVGEKFYEREYIPPFWIP